MPMSDLQRQILWMIARLDVIDPGDRRDYWVEVRGEFEALMDKSDHIDAERAGVWFDVLCSEVRDLEASSAGTVH